MDQTDTIFIREMKRIKLASKYAITAAKLPLKPLVKERYKSKKIPIAVDVRVTLRDAAMEKKQVKITYKKTSDSHEIKVYQIEPYSFRYLRLKVGVRKVLFGYDVKEKKIKSFALRNILKIEKIGTGYSARWPIEIGKKMRKKNVRKIGK